MAFGCSGCARTLLHHQPLWQVRHDQAEVLHAIAQEILCRLDLEGRNVPSELEDFIDRHVGRDRAMIPQTKHGLAAMACVSAMQKCVWRGLEKEAMDCEMIHTSKAFSMICNRLEVICHEDLDTLAAPWVCRRCDGTRTVEGPLPEVHR